MNNITESQSRAIKIGACLGGSIIIMFTLKYVESVSYHLSIIFIVCGIIMGLIMVYEGFLLMMDGLNNLND